MIAEGFIGCRDGEGGGVGVGGGDDEWEGLGYQPIKCCQMPKNHKKYRLKTSTKLFRHWYEFQGCFLLCGYFMSLYLCIIVGLLRFLNIIFLSFPLF